MYSPHMAFDQPPPQHREHRWIVDVELLAIDGVEGRAGGHPLLKDRPRKAGAPGIELEEDRSTRISKTRWLGSSGSGGEEVCRRRCC